MGARVRWLVLALVGALVLAGCALGPSQRPPVAVRGDQTNGPPTSADAPPTDPNALPAPEPLDTLIDYSDCTADTLEAAAAAGYPVPAGRALSASCGQLEVDTDPQRRGADTTRLGVLRVSRADAPRNRPALVVVGDSAAGGSARLAARMATLVSDRVLATYQLVGIDRRGTGGDLLDCAPPDARAALTDVPPVPGDAGLTGLLEDARAVVQDCYLLLDSAIGSYRTAATAADLEILRTQLRTAHLNVLGLGDGATAAAAWAFAHPRSVGRLVLDSPVDLATPEPDRTEARAAATEAAFDAFAAACVARGNCPLGPDPRAAVTGVVGGLGQQPLASADGDRLTAGGTLAALRAGLPDPARWPALAAGLAAAGAGDPSGLFAFLAPVLGDGGTFDAALATACNDSTQRLAPPQVAQLADRWAAQYPLFGVAAAQGLLACGPWPTAPGAPEVGTLPPEAAPVLVLGTAADARAPLAGAQHVAQSLGRSAFVGWQGAGQGAYPRNACVTALVEQTLLAGVLPRDGTVCPA
ncbi:alpha/beta hydrolase [Pseudonocardia oroxyli]|uniref:alpha/beta hydrolase n=1 Tax=Pseudonocardia oroxyli TaxID=366584 RepID=UPI00115FF10E|nr:alpha/beta hydrolase [Pseudonocardia oroxyli]